MKFFLALLFAAVLLMPIAYVYESKHDTEQAAEKVSDLHRRIDAEKEKISLLNAEYSALTQPERMEKLVRMYPERLQYVQMSAEQIVSIRDLPIRPTQADGFSEWTLDEPSDDLESLEGSE